MAVGEVLGGAQDMATVAGLCREACPVGPAGGAVRRSVVPGIPRIS